MTTRLGRSRSSSKAGFTLIEVLIAFVILAIGLLALESLGIGAARLVTRAERLAGYTAFASSELESSMATVRRSGANALANGSGSFPGGTWTRTVTRTALWAPTSADGVNETVETVAIRISVVPGSDDVLAQSDSFAVVGHVFSDK